MTIDKQNLQKLLWVEAASFRSDCADWKRNTEALQEFLGEKTVEEVALELLDENEALRLRCDRLDEDKQSMTETHVLYTWLRKKCDQSSNDFVAVQMNIGHDWVPVHDLDRALRSMIEREKP